MSIEQAIELIDEYLLEPNNICREWIECLTLCRWLLAKEIAEREGTTSQTPVAPAPIMQGSQEEEARRGEWLINSDGWYPYCSVCGEEPRERKMSKFCPDCGTPMRNYKK